MTENAIELNNLTKKFGDFTAVDDLSLHVKEGEIFGFLDLTVQERVQPLGCYAHLQSYIWKSYDFRLRPNKDSSKVRETIGLVAEKMIMYDNLTAAENLRFFGKTLRYPQR